ncbi:MAG: relaxase/mobilization nuclease domain-containing protein [Ktedonobacteraceae bacterium]
MDHEHRGVSYHKIVLSPGKDEPVEDWRSWTREVMGDLEERQGKDLHWFAVKHDNTDNPHVHVVLAGVGENRETGEREMVKMYQPDYQFLDQSGHDHSDHDWYREVSDMMKDFDRQDAQELGERNLERDHHDHDTLGGDRGSDRDIGDFDR